MPSHKAPSALPLARLHDGKVVSLTDPGKSRTPRTELLAMWALMDESQRDQLLLAAEWILAPIGEPVVVPVTPDDTYELQRGIAEEMAKREPLIRTSTL
jgi:hypothetical protein